MRQAAFYTRLPDDKVRCTLCPHACTLLPGRLGACGVRFNDRGMLVTLVDRRVVARHIEPIEKKPFFHFHPGSTAYSIATVGCNLRCAFCQNWEISQAAKGALAGPGDGFGGNTVSLLEAASARIPGEEVEPCAIVAAALRSGARSIAYTFTEPTVFFELAYETAVLAREAGLCNVFVTNGYISEPAVRKLAPVLDAANVDLKFSSDADYRRIAGARLAPIVDAIRLYHDLGVWVEVTSLLVTDLNDSEEQVRTMAKLVASIDLDMPWHVSRFFPAWKMTDRGPTPSERLDRAYEIGKEVGLHHVYVGNRPDADRESTFCPECGARLIGRVGLQVLANHIDARGCCPHCGTKIAGRCLNRVPSTRCSAVG